MKRINRSVNLAAQRRQTVMRSQDNMKLSADSKTIQSPGITDPGSQSEINDNNGSETVNLIQRMPENGNGDSDNEPPVSENEVPKTPEEELADLKQALSEGCSYDEVYPEARKILIAELANQISLNTEDRKLLISIVSGKGEVEIEKRPQEITPTEDMFKNAKEIITNKGIIDALIKNSQPAGTDLLSGNSNRGDDLEKWRENIMKNYEALMNTSENEYFDMESEKGAYKRTRDLTLALNALKIKKIRLEYRSAKITNRQTRTGKDKRQHRRTLRQTKKQDINKVRNSFQELSGKDYDALSEDMLGRQPKDKYKDDIAFTYDTDRGEIKSDIEDLHEKIRTQKGKSLEKHGKASFGDIGPAVNDYAPILDPKKDFSFIYKGEKYQFKFATIQPEDITPLVTPRANDSIIDKAPQGVETNIYSRLQGLDAQAAAHDNKQMDALYLHELNEVTVTNSSNPSTLRKAWSAQQAGQRRQELSDNYTALYNLKTDWDSWTTQNQSKMDEGIEYDKFGMATPTTMDAFYYWLGGHTPEKIDDVPIVWDEKEMKFKTKDEAPSGGKADDVYQTELAAYQKQVDKVAELNNLIKGGGKEPIAGYVIDQVKLRFLIELSEQYIEPQKWAEGAGTADIEINKEFQKAGTVKEGKEKTNLGQTTNVNTFVERQGEYNQAPEKRYGGYDETSGGYLRIPNNDHPVSEKLIWMVNYKIKVYKED
jgi:hypothetical protein